MNEIVHLNPIPPPGDRHGRQDLHPAHVSQFGTVTKSGGKGLTISEVTGNCHLPLLSRFGGKNECIALYTGGQRFLIGRLLPASSIHS